MSSPTQIRPVHGAHGADAGVCPEAAEERDDENPDLSTVPERASRWIHEEPVLPDPPAISHPGRSGRPPGAQGRRPDVCGLRRRPAAPHRPGNRREGPG